MQRALLAIYILFSAFLCAECILAQSTKTSTSQQKAAQYVALKLVNEKKGKELITDLQDMLTSLMLSSVLLEESEKCIIVEGTPDFNNEKATRRNRRNRRERENQRRDRQRRTPKTAPRRIHVRFRTVREVDDIA